jgi:hypothetical protein
MFLFPGSSKQHDISLVLRNRKEYFAQGLTAKTILNIKKMLFDLIFLPISIFISSIGLEFHKIELKKLTSGSTVTNFESFYNSVCSIKYTYGLENLEKIDHGFIGQEVKDISMLSEKAYSRMRRSLMRQKIVLPSLYYCNKAKSIMDIFYTVHKNKYGSYISPAEKFDFVLRKIYNKLEKKIKNDTFEIFLSGDGMQLTRTHTNTLNFTFKVINENDSTALYTLGN